MSFVAATIFEQKVRVQRLSAATRYHASISPERRPKVVCVVQKLRAQQGPWSMVQTSSIALAWFQKLGWAGDGIFKTFSRKRQRHCCCHSLINHGRREMIGLRQVLINGVFIDMYQFRTRVVVIL